MKGLNLYLSGKDRENSLIFLMTIYIYTLSAEYEKASIPGHTVHTQYWCDDESKGEFQENHYQEAVAILKIKYEGN